jgi:predicted NBD/HSP70 family sugar kinase
VAQRPGTPRLLREINDRTALELLLHHGAMTRGQLVERTGLSKPTASQLLARLEALGLVTVTGTAAGARGPSAQVYAIESTAGYAMGVDVSPGSARAGVADLSGQVQGLADGAVDARRSADPVAEVATVVRAAARAAKVPLRRVAHLVVASPGVHDDARDVLRHAEHMPAWARPGLRAALEAELRVPVQIENDVNVVAVAERARGAAVGADSFALLWVAGGLGLAIDLGGRVHRGATGGAGEVGYMPLPGFAAERSGGRPVNFQSLVSEQAVQTLARRHRIRAASAAASVGRAAGDVAGAGGGGPFLDELAERLATGIAIVVAVIDPQLVVLAGDTAVAGGEELRSRIERRLRHLTPLRPRLALTAITGTPVLAGALEVGLAATRSDLFTTSDATGSRAGGAR